ncbi:MAG: TolC family protein [Opitutaceae bacterium]|nr:TolC family protein [Opitutaceae bacterium]
MKDCPRMMLTRMPLLTALLFASGLQAQEPTPLSLDEALASVDRVNVNVLLSRESVGLAMEAANQQRVGLLPNVSLSAQQRRTKSSSISETSKSEGTPADRFDGRLSGSYMLYSPQQMAFRRAALVGVKVAELDLETTLQSVMASVAQTFFAHLRNVKRISVLDANAQRARELVTLARNRAEAGAALQIDITRAEAQLAIAEQARIQQDTVVYQSELLLKRLLDLDPAASLRLEDFEVRRTEQPRFVDGFEQTLFEKRVEYLRLKQALQQNQELFRASKLDRYGTLSLSGEWNLANTRVYEDDPQQGWAAGVAMSIPVFDGFRSRTNQRIALSQIRSQEFRLRQLELLISSEVRLAVQDARSRLAQVGVAEKSLRLAREELDLAEKRFREGVADNRELIDAQNRLGQAGDNLNEAIYLYNLSRVELARTQGDVKGILSERQK